MKYYENILETIGSTPLVKINKLNEGLKPLILAKMEVFNPGGSVKDRPALKMIEEAEKQGLLKPGGTIVEPTSGNTGTGLAQLAAVRGYNCILVVPEKVAPEKINLLKAYGAEVVVVPTVETSSHESYNSVANKLSMEIPGAFQPNQFANPNNPMAHTESTGPEIWEQTGGKITHFVAGIGTGGTISGTARFLKEKNPDIKIIESAKLCETDRIELYTEKYAIDYLNNPKEAVKLYIAAAKKAKSLVGIFIYSDGFTGDP